MLNLFEEFESCLENETVTDNIIDFLRKDTLGDSYESLAALRKDVKKINIPKRLYAKKQ